MKDVEDRGGAIKTINDGYMQREILNHFCQQQKAIESGERVVVRKNKYRVEGEEDAESRIVLHTVDRQAVREHIESVRRVKAEREAAQVESALARLRKAAGGTDNLMPYLVDAAKAYASIGEITKTLKSVWGEYKELVVV